MSSSDPESRPSLEREAFHCPSCGVYAHQFWLDAMKRERSTSRISALKEPDADWNIGICGRCKRPSVWRGPQMLYPFGGTAPVAAENMPDDVRELYEEARAVVGLSRRAGAALARATLERLLRGQYPDVKSNARLEDLILRAEQDVSSGLIDLLTLIRHVGNKSLHVADVPDDAVVMVMAPEQTELAEVLFAAINELVDELITKPQRNARLGALIPDGVRETIERKRAKGA